MILIVPKAKPKRRESQIYISFFVKTDDPNYIEITDRWREQLLSEEEPKRKGIGDELEELDQIVIKQLKNRYNDPTIFKRFVIGIDRSRMKLYDCEQEAQEELIDAADNYEDEIPDKQSKFKDFSY